ncbi:MAG: ATP-binding protein [Christensenellales bacterium]
MRISRAIASIRWRIVLAYLGVILVSFVIISSAVSKLLTNVLLDQQMAVHMQELDRLSVEVAPMMARGDADEMYQWARENGRELGGRILILSPQGQVWVDGFSQLNGVRLEQTEVQQVASGAKDRTWGFHELSDPDTQEDTRLWTAYCTASVIENADQLGILLFSVSLQDAVDTIAEFNLKIVILAVGVSAMVVVISLWMSSLITKPIVNMTKVVEKVGQGDLTQRVPVSGNSEISRLAETFNMMSERIQTLDDTRNEFVSNASHELKTPLSSIKILVETLIHSDFEDTAIYKEFLGDIDHEIDRLSAIINDLLNLVHFDAQTEIAQAPLRMDLIARTAAERLIPLAQGKKIDVVIDQMKPAVVLGDALKLEQVVSNLVDNAIKYTPEGGAVEVSLAVERDKVRLMVKDNGNGIAPEDLKHVFERFYRVDKARSRSSGGTGLGLAIVKRIVQMHGGTIHVSSKLGEGSVFTVELAAADPALLLTNPPQKEAQTHEE